MRTSLRSSAPPLAAVVILATGWQQADAVAGIAVRAHPALEPAAHPAAARRCSWRRRRRICPPTRSGGPSPRCPACAACTTSTSGPSPAACRPSRPTWWRPLTRTRTRSCTRSRPGSSILGLDHTTIQIDRDHAHELLAVHRRDCPEGPRPLRSRSAHARTGLFADASSQDPRGRRARGPARRRRSRSRAGRGRGAACGSAPPPSTTSTSGCARACRPCRSRAPWAPTAPGRSTAVGPGRDRRRARLTR